MLLAVIALVCAGSSADVFTTFLMEMKQPAEIHIVDRVEATNGFVNLRQILGSQTEYHFVHKDLSHTRNKRSVHRMRRLKVNPSLQKVVHSPDLRG